MHRAGAAARTAPARAPAPADWLRPALKRRGQWLRAPEAGEQASRWVPVGFSGAGGIGYRAGRSGRRRSARWVAAAGSPFVCAVPKWLRPGRAVKAATRRGAPEARAVSEERESWHEGAFWAASGVRRTPRAPRSAPLTYGRGDEDSEHPGRS